MSATPPTQRSREWLTAWDPENEASWDKALAWKTLWITTFTLTMAFVAWFLPSAIVPKLNALGYSFSKEQLYWLAAIPGLSGGLLRIVWMTLPPIVGLLHCGYAGFDFPSPGQSVRFPVTQWAWDGLARPIAVRLVGIAPDTPSYGTWAIDTHGTTSRYDDEVTFTAAAPPPTYAYTGVAYTVAAHGQRATCRIQSNAAQPPGGGG